MRHLGRRLESLARKAALSVMKKGKGLSVKKTDLFQHFGPAFADDEVTPRRPTVGISAAELTTLGLTAIAFNFVVS